MSRLDEAIEQLRIKKARQGYDLAEMVVALNKAKSTEEMMRIHKETVLLAQRIIAGAWLERFLNSDRQNCNSANCRSSPLRKLR